MGNTPSKSINPNAPVKARQTVEIHAPAGKAWEVFSGVNNWKSWQKDISSFRISGPFEPGSLSIGSPAAWRSVHKGKIPNLAVYLLFN